MKRIYGFININHLISVWNRYYKSQLNKENVIQLLKAKNILSKQKIYLENEEVY